jgi:ABC-2 type transport system ATP-binding protein
MADVVLRTEGLSKSYGSLVAVNELSLDVHQGEILGFLGPNGAGKTTSIDMMCGLLKPDRGRVLIDGSSIEMGDPGLRRRIGVCPQDVILWERLTCSEQLQLMGRMYGLSRSLAEARAEELLIDFELGNKKKSQARTLSGGMQRRLNLAMALIHDPEILLLDEPEVGLDPQSRVNVRSHIRSLARTKTIILTTHNMDEAERLADRVAIIDHGELLVLDTPEKLKGSVGEGDVLEITIEGQDNAIGGAMDLLAQSTEGASLHLTQDTLIVKAPQIVKHITDIVEILEREGIEAKDVRLRETTLEDVFIHLTGRRLRE